MGANAWRWVSAWMYPSAGRVLCRRRQLPIGHPSTVVAATSDEVAGFGVEEGRPGGPFRSFGAWWTAVQFLYRRRTKQLFGADWLVKRVLGIRIGTCNINVGPEPLQIRRSLVTGGRPPKTRQVAL